jgi:micrococcal nuclease
MKYLLPIFLLISTPAQAIEYLWPIKQVVDGDTIEIIIPNFPLKMYVRVAGIDTPEKAPKAKCEKEDRLAVKASDFTKKLIANAQEVSFSGIKHDKYGGRVLATVELDGVDLSASLIEAGLARSYHGEKKKGWCK